MLFTSLVFWAIWLLTPPAFPDSRQLLVVQTDGFNEKTGTLSYYERNPKTNRWQRVLGPWAVVVGKNGLAWGAGLLNVRAESGPRKREGDGRSPAGAFRLGACFGYGAAPAGLKLPYLRATPSLVCVDDPASRYYNRVFSADSVRKDWSSAERMQLPSDDYKLGLVVEYNWEKPVQGAGSCIFVHLWENPAKGTAGCTAFSEGNFRKLLVRLDAVQKPVLVQMPGEAYRRWRHVGLP